ncbi:hypothetical protein AYK26_00770 [Euryarchaeota archaeon SM23-78]|nr:MAG: hypothetical protein AYK26_00770 [Euryarchaeota archaeon SM23-78]
MFSQILDYLSLDNPLTKVIALAFIVGAAHFIITKFFTKLKLHTRLFTAFLAAGLTFLAQQFVMINNTYVYFALGFIGLIFLIMIFTKISRAQERKKAKKEYISRPEPPLTEEKPES